MPFALAGLTLLATLLAEPAPAGEGLTLQRALDAALATHPALVAADAGAAAAQAELLRARVAFPENPELTLEFIDDGPFDDEGSRSQGLTLSQAFWAPGQRSSRISAADSLVTEASHSREWARRQVAADAATAWAELRAAQARVHVAGELAGLLERVAEATEQSATAGRVSEFERNRVRIETAAALAELSEIRVEELTAREALAMLTGLAPDELASLGAWPVPLPPATLAGLAALDLRERPDVAAAREAVGSAEARVQVERKERLPRLTLAVGIERDREVIGGEAFHGLPFATDEVFIRDSGRSARVEVGIALPLADRNRGGIAAALADRSRAEAELLATERAAASETRLLVARCRLLAESLGRLDDTSELLAGSLDVLERAHALGRMALTDVLLERERLLRGSLLRERIRGERAVAELRLAALTGMLVPQPPDIAE